MRKLLFLISVLAVAFGVSACSGSQVSEALVEEPLRTASGFVPPPREGIPSGDQAPQPEFKIVERDLSAQDILDLFPKKENVPTSPSLGVQPQNLDQLTKQLDPAIVDRVNPKPTATFELDRASLELNTAIRSRLGDFLGKSRDEQHQAFAVIADQEVAVVKQQWNLRADPVTGNIDPRQFFEFLLVTDRNLQALNRKLSREISAVQSTLYRAAREKNYLLLDVALVEFSLANATADHLHLWINAAMNIYQLKPAAFQILIDGSGFFQFTNIDSRLSAMFLDDISDPVEHGEALQEYHRQMQTRRESFRASLEFLIERLSFRMASDPLNPESFQDVSFYQPSIQEYGRFFTSDLRFLP